MNNICAIIIPIYKDKLDETEYNNVLNNISILSNYDIFFIYPKSLDIKYYKKIFKNIKFKSVANKYFGSCENYSILCCNPMFYKLFIKYEYMLICQTDAYVFKDELLYWCNKGYDYIGALSNCDPCILKQNIEKNNILRNNIIDKYNNIHCTLQGGLSLRKTKSLYNECLNKYNKKYTGINLWEDYYICDTFNLNFPNNIFEIFEFSAENLDHINYIYPNYINHLPFGCHRNESKKLLKKIFNKYEN